MADTTEITDPVVHIEKLLGELTTVDHDLTELQSTVDKEVAAVIAKHAPKVDPLTTRRAELVDEVAKLFEANRDQLLAQGKTIVTRSGTLNSAFGAEAIDIEDEATAMAYTRKKGMLRKVTKPGKRSFVKAALKKFPDFVAACPGMILRKTEFLHIKLVKTQVEIKQDLAPYRRALQTD